MSCSRCGASRAPRSGPAPSIISRGGASRVVPPVSRPVGVPTNIIRQSIIGLRYVPNK